MNDISLWFSGAALLVSVIALLYSLSKGSAQARLSYEQKRSDLRQEFHLAALRIVELVQKIMSDASEPKKVIIAQNLADAGLGIADCHKRLRKLSPPLVGATRMESELMDLRADANELLQALDLAAQLLDENKIDDLHDAVSMIHQRVWAGKKKATQQDTAQDGESATTPSPPVS